MSLPPKITLETMFTDKLHKVGDLIKTGPNETKVVVAVGTSTGEKYFAVVDEIRQENKVLICRTHFDREDGTPEDFLAKEETVIIELMKDISDIFDPIIDGIEDLLCEIKQYDIVICFVAVAPDLLPLGIASLYGKHTVLVSLIGLDEYFGCFKNVDKYLDFSNCYDIADIRADIDSLNASLRKLL